MRRDEERDPLKIPRFFTLALIAAAVAAIIVNLIRWKQTGMLNW